MLEQRSEVSAAPDVKEESLARQHSDLRLAPVEPDESRDMSDPLNHFDLRIVRAESDQESKKK
jgi:hypothetical protein